MNEKDTYAIEKRVEAAVILSVALGIINIAILLCFALIILKGGVYAP